MIGFCYSAPFAVFRDFQTGSYRSTFRFTSPSALYGLILNIAGLEMRQMGGDSEQTLTDTDLPCFELASASRVARGPGQSFSPSAASKRNIVATQASPVLPRVQSVSQHIQTIPNVALREDERARAKGRKVHTECVRREFLSGVRGVCYLKGEEQVESLVMSSLQTPSGFERYGLPFLGDNNFYLEELGLIPERDESVHWLIDAGDRENDSRPIRMTNWVDRRGGDTRFGRFVTFQGSILEPPPGAWVKVGPSL